MENDRIRTILKIMNMVLNFTICSYTVNRSLGFFKNRVNRRVFPDETNFPG
jgi:hypothetical protein